MVKPITHLFLKPFFLRRNRRKQASYVLAGIRTNLMNPHLVTIFETSPLSRVNFNKYERKLRRKATRTRLSLIISALLFGWFVIESAQAINLF